MGRSVMKIQRAILISLLLGVLGTGLWRDPAAAQGDAVGEVIQLVNQFRAENGLSPLVMDGSLMAAAQSHANWITATGQYGHSGEGGSTPQDRARAAGYTGIAYENYVYGTALTPSQAVQWWKNSAIHRATMLLSRGEQVGLGYVGGESNLYVLVVGHPTPPPPTRSPNSSSGQGNSAAEEEPAEEEDPGPVVVPITLAEPDENGTVTHVVQQGQTAWAIAARYEVDLDGMLAINGLVRPAVLKPGDRVIVRLGEGQAPPPTPTPLLNYTVQAGETIWEIAVRNGLTVDELLALNGLTRQDVLLPGTELRLRDPGEIPTPVPTDTPPPPTATPDQAAIAATAAAEAFAAAPSPTAPSPAAPNTTPDATPTTAPDLSPSAPPPTRDSSGGPPTLPPPGSADSVPAPPVTPEAVTATAPTTAQAVAALPGSGVVVSAPPASNPPAARRADDSGPNRAVIVGVLALGAVWIMVGAAVVWSWMQNRRGR